MLNQAQHQYWEEDGVIFNNVSQLQAYLSVKACLEDSNPNHKNIVQQLIDVEIHQGDEPYYTARRIFNLLGSNDRLVLVEPDVASDLFFDGAGQFRNWKDEPPSSSSRILETEEFSRNLPFMRKKVVIFTDMFKVNQLGEVNLPYILRIQLLQIKL